MCGGLCRAGPGVGGDFCSHSSLGMCSRTAQGSPSQSSRATWWDCLLEKQSNDDISLTFQSLDPSSGFKAKCLTQPCSASMNAVEEDFPLFAVPLSSLVSLSMQAAHILFSPFFLFRAFHPVLQNQHRYVFDHAKAGTSTCGPTSY